MVPNEAVPHREQPLVIFRKFAKSGFHLPIEGDLFGRREPIAKFLDAAAKVLHDPCLVPTEVRASRNPLKI